MSSIRIWIYSLLIVALLGGGGYLAYRYLFRNEPEKALAAAESAYAAGEQAVKSSDWATAAARFEEASLQASTTLDAVARADTGASSPETLQKLREIQGKAAWVKTRALRERAYALAEKEGKPLRDFTDPFTNDKFHVIFEMPNAKENTEAGLALRLAGRLLPNESAVQLDALRFEELVIPKNWEYLALFSSNALLSQPNDPRASYLLARYDFEQPVTSARGSTVTAPKQRARTRVDKALKSILVARNASKEPLWRIPHLEAKIREWLTMYGTDKKEQKEKAENEQELHALLFDEKNGALAQALRGEGTARMNEWDIEGYFELPLMALDIAIDKYRKVKGDPETALDVFDKIVQIARNAAANKERPAFPGKAGEMLVTAAAKAQPLLLSADPKQREQRKAAILEVAELIRSQKTGSPGLYGQFAELLKREAYLEGKNENPARQAELNKLANQWIDEGLKLAAEQKTSPALLIELHAQALHAKIRGGNRADLLPHLKALRDAKQPRAESLANLFDGIQYEREGKLDKARQALEKVLDSPHTEITLQAQLVLANLYRALGQPDKAAASLRAVDRLYASFNQLPESDRAWIREFVRGEEDIAYTLLVTSLEAGQLKAAQLLKKKPADPKEVAAVLLAHEKEAQAQLKKLTKYSDLERRARMSLVGHLLATGRAEQAKKELSALQATYPASVEILQMEIALALREASKEGSSAGLDEAARKKFDTRIQDFIKNTPGELGGKLYWAVWLTRTNRAAEAVKYLEDPTNFPGERDNRYKRILAQALLGSGQSEEGMELLRHLPTDPGVDVALVRLMPTAAERRHELDKALTSYEDKGAFLVLDASMDLDEGKHEEAIDGYLKALEYTRVNAAARRGLQRALVAFARTDPQKMLKRAELLLKDYPKEPAILLGYAFASLMLDDIGSTIDDWDKKKNMASALSEWALLHGSVSPDRVIPLLTRAEFWSAAGRPDQAHVEVDRALALEAKHEAALQVAVRLALASADPTRLSKAREQVKALRTLKPQDVSARHLEAQVESADNKTDKAIEIYESILKDQPKDSTAYQRLFALLLLRDGSMAKARELEKRWREQLPDDVFGAQAEMYLLASDKKIAEAKQVMDQFLAAHAKRVDEAIAKLKPAPKADPKKVEELRKELAENSMLVAELELVKGFARAKNWEEASAGLKRILDKRPTYRAAQLIQGDVALGKEDWAAARAIYEKILNETKGVHFIAANNLAWVLAAKLNQPAEALKIADQARKGQFSGKTIAVERLPESFLDTLGVIYTGLKDPARAKEMRELFKAALKRYPTDPRMPLYLGHAYFALGEPSTAATWYTQAERLAAPGSPTTLTAAQRQEVIQAVQAARKKMKEPGQR